MDRALAQFQQNIQHVRNLRGIYAAVQALTTSVLDLSDLLRAQIVMLVSAMDHYVHGIARLGMLEIQAGVRPTTPAYLRFQVSLDCVAGLIGGATAALDAELRARHGHLSFQQPDKIAEAIRHVSSISLWEAVANRLAEPVSHVKETIELIVSRRNKIAHEADVNPVDGSRWPISEAMVDDAIDRIEKICQTIHSLL
jgi:hypothetical protein